MTYSIIIPSYNQQDYLADAIESALNQTLPASTVIVVDDGSTDDSLQIARRYESQNERILVISQVNKGLASARNTGIMNSNADYDFFLDSDDMMLENCLECIEDYRIQTDADIIAPSFKAFGTVNNELILGNPTIEDFKTANRIGYFSAVRHKWLLKVGGYSSRMTWGYEDYHLWFDLLKRGARLVTIPEILMLYRTKERSMIHEAQEHHIELMNQIFKDHKGVFTL